MNGLSKDSPPGAPSVFTSRRERRLWFWTGVVVLAIFSTLGLANALAFALGESGVIAVGLFLLCCFLVLLTVLAQGLDARPGGLEIAVGLGVVAAYVLVFVRMSIPTERSHLIEYGVVAIFVYEALLERARHRPLRLPGLLAVSIASLVGVADEGVQFLLPTRVFDPVDILFNVLAATMAVTASASMRWARRKVSESRSR